MISRQAGMVVAGEATIILLAINDHNCFVIQNDAHAEESRRLAEDSANPANAVVSLQSKGRVLHFGTSTVERWLSG